MKKLSIVLLLVLFLLPLTSCQSKENASNPAADNAQQAENQGETANPISLTELPDTKDMTFIVEGTEETVPVTKALHNDYYAMYYDAAGFTYVPGEILDTGFSDSFVSLYDDETTTVLTTMKICYTARVTPEEWVASTPGTEWAPQTDLTDFSEPSWESVSQTAALGDETQSFQVWAANKSAGVTNICYTTSFRDGCLAVIVSYPDEVAEGWGARMEQMVQTLLLAAA